MTIGFNALGRQARSWNLLWAGFLLLLGVAGLPSRAQTPPSQGLLREVYSGIPGVSVADLTGAAIFPNSPTTKGYVTAAFEAPTDVLDNYGQRLRGYLVPPVTGNYTFWIASDDGSELWLSTDDTVGRRTRIASVSAWTGPREWAKEAGQQSAPVRLEAGRSYYVEALMKEGGGGDNLAVRWLRPDGADEGPIPGKYLLPWGVVFKAPSIVRQPQSTNAVEGTVARFDVLLDPLSPSQFQWRRNGVSIPGATNAFLDFQPVRLTDDLARFSVALSNSFGTAVSTEAVLSVTPDTVPPRLVKAENRSARLIRVVFSEAVDPTTAQTPANYTLLDGGVIETATISADGSEVVLGMAPLVFGKTYTLTVSGVRDRAASPNVMPAGSLVFTALEYIPNSIGSVPAGTVVRVGDGQFDVTGIGVDLGGTQDRFLLAAESRTGDFDLQVRVAGVTVTDPFVHAGLMVRDSLESNARFAAVFASSAQLGCFFESRTSIGAASAQASITGGYPVGYPQAWLRLRRAGSAFTGFASMDGRIWTQLGTVTIQGMPASLFFGPAVSSQDEQTPTTAQFRDLGPVVSTAVGPWVADREPLGPFVRSTGLVLSELMYHPLQREGQGDLEFIEIYNAGSTPENLSGARLSGEVQFTFPEGTRIRAGEFLVVAASPSDLQRAAGLTKVLGPYEGRLSNGGGSVALKTDQGDTLFRVEYQTRAPWPITPDGTGHSLVLGRPSYGPSDPRAWMPSRRVGGTPGGPEILGARPLDGVVINEFLAHTDDPQRDFIELFNASNAEMDLVGCVLTDSITTNRFRFPVGTTIPARGHLVLDQNQLGFALSAAGETIYLVDPTGERVLDALEFGPQENAVSSGRQPDGATEVRRLVQPTPGAANTTWRPESIVISELMYNPISRADEDEYVELFNRTGTAIDLGGWEFTAGIGYRFPPGAVLPAAGYLVVAKDPARLRAHHPHLTVANTVGGFSGTLSNSGERIALARPDEILSTNDVGTVSTRRILIDVAEVTYLDGGQWGKWADGGGSSLELIDPDADPNRGSNWADSDETTKGQWTSVAVTGRLDNGNSGFPPNQLQVTLQGEGEALVDSVEVIRSGGTANLVSNPGFEAGSGSAATGWTFQGNHSQSTIDSTGAEAGSRCLHIRAPARGDTGFNRIRTPLAAGLADGTTATIRARVRWVTGWPEVLFRIRGNWLELPASLTVPANLGSPGLLNTRAVPNAGPAIVDVAHTPALPANQQAVIVSARVSDPDGVASVRAIGRIDGGGTAVNVTLRDDGSGGDVAAGDGVYSGTISGRAAGTLIAFRIEAIDGAGLPMTTRFPAEAPARECLVRWGEPIPFGTLGHYHMWNTTTVENARNSSSALNNLLRDLTFVYGNSRVVYAAGFKDKGSPFHGGGGDWYIVFPNDQPMLGSGEMAITSTGNVGSDSTNLREQLCFSIARGIGAGYLHRRYVRLYRNGGLFRDIMEDSEEPNGDYAERFFSEGENPDLYKIEDWFEFEDDGTSFSNVDATLQRFTTPPGSANAPLKPARYRWSWRKRAVQGSANDMTNLLQLVDAVNVTGATYVNRVFSTIDVDHWMRAFAFQRIVGNWDSYGMGRGKNMYAYKRDGMTWKLFPWDVDFALDAGGNGAGDALWGAGDPVINVMFDNPAIRRRLWQAYIDAVNGPMLPERVAEEVDSRAEVLLQNGVPLTSNTGAKNYVAARRQTILNALNSADVPALEVTSNGGADQTVGTPSVTLVGNAPLALTSLTVNGTLYPVTWTTFTRWQMTVPLTERTNRLVLGGMDRFGRPIPGYVDSVTVVATGDLLRAEDFVVINEIQYNPSRPGASFIELHNTAPTTPFNLSGCRIEGVGYTFPDGSVIPANGYLVLAADAAGFAAAYGSAIPVFGTFPGTLSNEGEYLALICPDPAGGANIVVMSDVTYSPRPPWPTNAAGWGPSLQLIDPAQDAWRVANWMASETNAAVVATPGKVNVFRSSLATFPDLWINEVLPNNVMGPADDVGRRGPFIELHNRGINRVDLAGCFLTDTLTDLGRWAFPDGTGIPPGGFLVVWADGQPAGAGSAALHANFSLVATNGFVALTRRPSVVESPVVLDYLEYGLVGTDRSFGSFPDGEPRARRVFQTVTPGAPNNPAVSSVAVTINEFLAGNTKTLSDPADGDFDDWFELHNEGPQAVDLSGYYLTDSTNNPTQFRIPVGTVLPADGFLLVWADGEPGQNLPSRPDLHVNFRLSLSGEQIALFDPNGRRVDEVTFGPQMNDASQGRFPDGAPLPLVDLEIPTPKEPNVVPGGNPPPVLRPIGPQTVQEGSMLTFTASAQDSDAGQVLEFSLSTDAPPGAVIDKVSGLFTWTPGEADGPGQFAFAVRVTDSGVPRRTTSERIVVTVRESNEAPLFGTLIDRTVSEGELLSFTVAASDPDRPQQVLRFQIVEGPAGAVLDAQTGVFSWTPGEEHGPGVFTARVRVGDQQDPEKTVEGSFQITVLEVDNPPRIVPLAPVVVTEGDRLSVQVQAQDVDSPISGLRYELAAGARQGMSIDSKTGLLTWQTAESDGPSAFEVVIRVTQTEGAIQSDQFALGITVLEKNEAPVLAAIPDQKALEGDLVSVSMTATDPDLPKQTLIYTLALGAPEGAEIDPVLGVFRWRVPGDFGAGRVKVTVSVADNGPGTLSDSRSFEIVVDPRFRVAINEIHYRPSIPQSGFVELFNPSTKVTWNLGGLRLLGAGVSFTFPEGTVIGPGAFLCVVADLDVFRKTHGTQPTVAGAWTGSMGDLGDRIRLVRTAPGGAGEETLAEVAFESQAPWPVAAAGGGAALQRIDARRDGTRVGNWSASAAYTGPRDLVAYTSTWSYFQTGPVSADWKDPGFKDAAWPTGKGLLYVESAALPEPKNTALTLGQTTYYFRTRFTLPSVPNGVGLVLNTILDDGAVVYLNGVEVFRQNIDAAVAVDFNTFANGAVDNAVVTGPFTLPAAALRTGENVLAVEVHQVNAGSSDIVFGCELKLEGGNVPALTPGLPNNVLQDLLEFPPVYVGEIVPRNVTGLKDGAGEREPWIEIVNRGDEPVSLEGWTLSNATGELGRWTFPVGAVLKPRSATVIFADGQTIQGLGSEWHTPFVLDAAQGVVLLSRPQTGGLAVVDYLRYRDVPEDRAVVADASGLPGVGRIVDPTPGIDDSGSAPNRAPQFAVLGEQTVVAGSSLALQLVASDPDPGQALRFELVSGPVGLTVSPQGRVDWTPGPAQIGGFEVQVRVVDDGTPPLAATAGFVCRVRSVSAPMMSAVLDGDTLVLGLPTTPGVVYRVEVQSGLESPTWTLLREFNGTGSVELVRDPVAGERRFYRVVVP